MWFFLYRSNLYLCTETIYYIISTFICNINIVNWNCHQSCDWISCRFRHCEWVLSRVNSSGMRSCGCIGRICILVWRPCTFVSEKLCRIQQQHGDGSGTLVLWQRSEQDCNMRCESFIRRWWKSPPAPVRKTSVGSDTTIEKEDCLNHVTKRLGTALEGAESNTGWAKEG